jgi:hypothetical protein
VGLHMYHDAKEADSICTVLAPVVESTNKSMRPFASYW